MDLNETRTEAVAIEALAACNQSPREIGGVPVLVLPDDFEAKSMEHVLVSPARKKGTVVLNDSESFVAVVNDQKGESTRLFSTIDPPTFTAVFNHTALGTGWGDHRAKYNAPLSPEWEAWTGKDGVKMNQVDIAQFIENNLLDVAFIAPDAATRELGSPDGAMLLEICRTLQAKKKVDFKSSVRLADGSTQFTYDEDVQGSAVKGTLAVPEQFSLGIPVFENGEKWRVDVRLRYRIADGGQLTMWLELIRAHKVIEQADKDLRDKIAAATELQILNGTPSN